MFVYIFRSTPVKIHDAKNSTSYVYGTEKKHNRGVNKNNMHSILIVNDTGKSLKSSLRTARARADTT